MHKSIAQLLSATVLALGFSAVAHAQVPPPPPQSDHGAHHMARPDGPKAPQTRAEMEAMVKARFTEADANKDGFVTAEEMEGARHAHMQAMMDDMFKRIDSNGDGQISRAEFDAHHAAMHGDMEKMHGQKDKADKRAMKMGAMPDFAASDGNKDGKLSLAEMQATAADHFAKMDSNKDGTISRDEQKAARKNWKDDKRAARKK